MTDKRGLVGNTLEVAWLNLMGIILNMNIKEPVAASQLSRALLDKIPEPNNRTLVVIADFSGMERQSLVVLRYRILQVALATLGWNMAQVVVCAGDTLQERLADVGYLGVLYANTETALDIFERKDDSG